MRLKYIKNVIVILAVVLTSFSNLNEASGQKGDTISDFYEYVNKEWLDCTIIPENTVVVNNSGILWDKITDKSIEILSGDSIYYLDMDHLYILKQLQNFYNTTHEYSDDDRKRVKLVQKHYPMLFGVLFSKITVSTLKEEKIKEIIKFLRKAYGIKIKNSIKIGDYYKDLFISKLDNMEFEIGSPDISCFPKMPILSANSLKKNIQLSEEYQNEKSRSGHISDWNSEPFETYCFYNFHDNKVKIYSGFLYDSDVNEGNGLAYYYATIGRTISHEMAHAFDNVGKNYDKDGKHINWFEKIFSGALFAQNDWNNTYRALIKQYGQFTIQDSLFIDGKKTLQENIADLGGVEISLLSLKLYLNDNHLLYSEREQSNMIKEFFIIYAQSWREKASPEFERSSIKRLHTPQRFRAIGPIYNQNEFYEIFEIDKESKYYVPGDLRVRIW